MLKISFLLVLLCLKWYTNYIFEGVKKGATTVIFRYVSIIDNSIEKEEIITLKVDENRNISLNTIP